MERWKSNKISILRVSHKVAIARDMVTTILGNYFLGQANDRSQKETSESQQPNLVNIFNVRSGSPRPNSRYLGAMS
jgi:hypothetical protein